MAFPLDMSQFRNLFNSTRIPTPEEDVIKAAEIPQKYVLIAHKGRLFKVFAVDSSWNVRRPEEILGRGGFFAKNPIPRINRIPGIFEKFKKKSQ